MRQNADSDQREGFVAKWGLIPSWAKDAKIGNSCSNARSESRRVMSVLDQFSPDIDSSHRPQNLFYRPDWERDERLSAAVDRINREFGRSSIRFAAEGIAPKWAARVDQRSPRYTTRWDELPEVG